MLASSIVKIEQFEVNGSGITHKPTSYNFTPYPSDPTSGTVNMGRLGEKLPSGEDYRPHEVQEMAQRLWLRYCKDNGML